MVESHVLMKKNLSIPVLADEIQKKNTEAPVLAGASLLASLGFLCPGGGERWEKMGKDDHPHEISMKFPRFRWPRRFCLGVSCADIFAQ